MSGQRKVDGLDLAGVDRNEITRIVAEVTVATLFRIGKQLRTLD